MNRLLPMPGSPTTHKSRDLPPAWSARRACSRHVSLPMSPGSSAWRAKAFLGGGIELDIRPRDASRSRFTMPHEGAVWNFRVSAGARLPRTRPQPCGGLASCETWGQRAKLRLVFVRDVLEIFGPRKDFGGRWLGSSRLNRV